MIRVTRLIPVFLVVTVSGCAGAGTTTADRLGNALDATGRTPRVVAYQVTTSGHMLSVAVRQQDDLRYAATVRRDGATVENVVVNDDAVAVQLLDGRMVTSATAQPTTSGALRAGRWVLDPTGAPPPVVSMSTSGVDPLRDALAVLTYGQQAVHEAAAVTEYNPSAVSYAPDQDPFPKPGKGERRFDLVAQPLLPGNDISTVPTADKLRQMAIYVDGRGIVQMIRERIGVLGQLDRILRLYSVSTPRDATDQQRADLALAKINAIRHGHGLPPIEARSVTVTFTDQGGAIPIELPAKAAAGTLESIPGLGPTAHAPVQGGGAAQ